MTIQQTLEQRLARLAPTHLAITNESAQHNVPPNSETHFKVVIVSDAFTDTRLVKRHQIVYGLVDELMQNPIHALSLHTYSPDEWKHQDPSSPSCLGGKAREDSSNSSS